MRPIDCLILVTSLMLAACAGEHETRAVPEPRIATLDELDQAIRANLGNGALINFWATW